MKRNISLALALCVALSMLFVPGASSETVYYLAIDDRLMQMTASYIPLNINGSVYVPQAIFENSAPVKTGLTLAIAEDQYTLYSRTQSLTFSLGDGTAVDENGNTRYYRMVLRNGRAYFPAVEVCQHFSDLSYERRPTEYVYDLIRITTPNAVLSGSAFLSSAGTALRSRYNDYVQPSVNPPPSPTPSQDPTSPGRNINVYLAVRVQGTAYLGDMLDHFSRAGVYGLFFFEADMLKEADELVRRVVGQGHMIGLTVSQEDGSESVARGNELLSHIARTSTRILLNESGQEQPELAEDGYVFWQDNVSGIPAGTNAMTFADQLVQQIRIQRNSAWVILDSDSTTSRGISRLLFNLQTGGYNIRVPVETELSGG